MSRHQTPARFAFRIVATTLIAILCGCSQDSAVDSGSVTAEPTPLESNATTTADPVQELTTDTVEVPEFDTAPPLELDANSYETADACIAAMQKALDDSIVRQGQPPTSAGIAEAIRIGDEGQKQFPDNENLLRAAIAVRYQSLELERDVATVSGRQLELGRLARILVERNQDNLEQLGAFPAILVYEESKGYLAQSNVPKGWESLVQARQLGFNQSRLVFLEPAFQDLIEDKQKLNQILSWVDEDVERDLETQEPFPFQFQLKSLTEEDTTVSLKDYEGKVVLVDIWGTWCPPCRATIPHLVKLSEAHKDDLAVVGINFESPSGPVPIEETKQSLGQFLAQEPLPYSCLYGTRDVLIQIPGWKGFPTILMLDRTGRIRWVGFGYQSGPVLASVVGKLIAEK